ncbi:MAG: hypothetical protein ABL876_07970 [Chitinophagaceae bacterium]
MKTGQKKLVRITAGEYVYRGLNGDISVSKKEDSKTDWTVSGEVVGEFFRSTVESFKEAKRIAFETDGV